MHSIDSLIKEADPEDLSPEDLDQALKEYVSGMDRLTGYNDLLENLERNLSGELFQSKEQPEVHHLLSVRLRLAITQHRILLRLKDDLNHKHPEINI